MKLGFGPLEFVPLVTRWTQAAFTLDARSLAAYRIGLGLVLVADSLLRTRDFSLMLAPDGMFPLSSLAQFHGSRAFWSLAFLHDSAWCSGSVLALEAVAGGALAIGWRSRLATVAAWVAVVSLIRRASPAANAGDFWLACQLFWAMFLPLGARWSLDAVRRPAAAEPPPTAVCSVASAALLLQLAAVYLGAGLAKLNSGWLTGEALTHALSVHDHGKPLGMMLGGIPWLARPLQWLVVAGELAVLPVLVALPQPRVRGLLVAAGWAFHLAIWFGMTVGLFAVVGIVAWLPLIPGAWWPTVAGRGRQTEHHERVVGLGRGASWACGLALALAILAFIHHVTPLGRYSLPLAVRWPLNLACLFQDWAMFGGVPAQEQWVYGRAVLADGSAVDLLRGGRPLEEERPAGGFTSLPHHRWHKFLWILPREPVRVFAPPAAAALVRHWNQTHPPDRQVTSFEIRLGIQDVRSGDDTVRDFLLASWPPVSSDGGGNLARFLEAHAP